MGRLLFCLIALSLILGSASAQESASVGVIPIGESVSDTLSTKDASNVHAFAIDQTADITVVVDSELDIVFKLYSGSAAVDLTDANLIDTVDLFFSGKETLNRTLEAGSYLVVVESFGMAESGPYRVTVSDPSLIPGAVVVLAGTSELGFSGDGGPATLADLRGPQSVFGDENGDIYLTDRWNMRVRRVSPDGSIDTVIGNGVGGAGAVLDIIGREPLDATIDITDDVFILPDRIVYFESQDRIIRRDASGSMSFVAGAGHAPSDGDLSGDGSAATEAFVSVSDFFVTADERIYIADRFNNRIRMVDSEGVIVSIAGTGAIGFGNGGFSGDGGPTTDAELNQPNGVFLDRAGNVFFADVANHRVRRIDAVTGIITTIAGSGAVGSGNGGFSGGGGPATEAIIDRPSDLFVDDAGTVFFSTVRDSRVHSIDSDGILRTVYTGEGEFDFPPGLFVDSRGDLLLADEGTSRILKIVGVAAPTTLPLGPIPETVPVEVSDPDGPLKVVVAAGTGIAGFSGDGGSALDARLNRPRGIWIDPEGNILIADQGNNVVRRIDTNGTISTVVGGEFQRGFSGDGGQATDAELDDPVAVFIDSGGNLFIADTANGSVRRVSPEGIISTVAGNGNPDVPEEGSVATSTSLGAPFGLTGNASGELFVADLAMNQVFKVGLDGSLQRFAGIPIVGIGDGSYSGDGGPATEAAFNGPGALAIDLRGRILIADFQNHRGRRVELDGTVTTIAGNGLSEGPSGDGGPATEAVVFQPGSLAIGPGGTLYIGGASNTIRRVGIDGVITTIAGTGETSFEGEGPAEETNFIPSGMVVAADSTLYVADFRNDRIYRLIPDATGDPISEPTDPTATDGDTPVSADIGNIVTVAGGFSAIGGSALDAFLPRANALAVDQSGSIYIGIDDFIRVIDASGTMANFAGGGETSLFSLSGTTPAADARVGEPTGISIGADGSMYVADNSISRVYRITDSQLSLIAGQGSSIEDGIPAADSDLTPNDVFVTDAGVVYVTDGDTHRLRKIDLDGTITTVAGTGDSGFGGDGGPATAAQLNRPKGVAVDASGNIYVADAENNRVRRVDASGTITTFAGSGSTGSFGGGYGGDGGPATDALLNWPTDIQLDDVGNVYITDESNDAVRKVDANGTISTVAGIPLSFFGDSFGGDGGPATEALMDGPSALAIAQDGALLILTGDGRLRRVDENGIVSTISGIGPRPFRDEVAAIEGRLDNPNGIYVDDDGTLYIADRNNARIRRVDTSGRIETIAGGGDSGEDGLPAKEAQLFDPAAVDLGPDGSIYIADVNSHRIRRVTPSGLIETVAGTRGSSGFSGDGGPATDAQIQTPDDVFVDKDGAIWFSDAGNHRVRKVDSSGIITTVAGSGESGFSGGGFAGDGGPATEALLNRPDGVFVDAAGALYITSTRNDRVRRVDPAGTIQTIGGDDSFGTTIGALATQTKISDPQGVYVDVDGSVYIAASGKVLVIQPDGVLDLVAGNGSQGASGDGGPATDAELTFPKDVFLGPSGDIYVADGGTDRVRKIIRSEQQSIPDTPTGPSADFDGDGSIEFSDFILFAAAFGLNQGDSGYDARFDLDGDGSIGFPDFLTFAGAFGT